VILVDTWAWIALADRHDPHHKRAVQAHNTLGRQRCRYMTTDYILCETISPLFAVLGFAQAERFMRRVFQSIQLGRYQLERITPARFEVAWQLRLRYHDKLDISFVDLTSMAVMLELGITDVFTGDGHFRQVNLGFNLVP
jgi:predicted nucleic acid-binding protein